MGDDQRIRQNVATMRAKGATDAEVEHYLANVEGLSPAKQSPLATDLAEIRPPNSASVPLRQDLADLRRSVESTRVSPSAPKPPPSGAKQGVVDATLNSLTLGLHQKGVGLTDALLDIVSRGTQATPVDTYRRSTEATSQRIQAAGQHHPLAKTAGEAVGFFAPLAIEAPARAVMGLPKVVEAARGSGAANVAKRIGKNAVLGGAAGAAVTGTTSQGDLADRPKEMAVGGLLGALFGGGTTAAAEGISGAGALAKRVFQPASRKGARVARQQITERLAASQQMPDDLLDAAARANATGAPVVSAHLGGPAMDDLTYLGASSMTPSGAGLKQSLTAAQRGEHEFLQRGITEMSGIADTPANRTSQVLRTLDDTRTAAGKADYPVAYSGAPIENPAILEAIRRDPDLRDALGEGLDVLLREDELARLQTGTTPTPRINPLDAATGPAQPTEIGQQLIAMGVPEAKVRAAGHFTQPADAPALPIKLLDYMKRGVEPLIQRKTQREGLQPHDANIIRAKVQTILGMVDAESPQYQATRARQASLFGQEDAARAGAKAFDRTADEIGSEMADLTGNGQPGAYRATATSSLREQVSKKRRGSDVGAAIFDSPERQQQLDAVYGADARQRLDPYLEQGGIVNRVLRAATGGSQTEPRAAVRLAARDAAGANVPTSIAGARKALITRHSQRVERAMAETLAQELNIPADSPELRRLVDRLYAAMEQGRRVPDMLPTVSDAVSHGLLARLAAESAAGSAR